MVSSHKYPRSRSYTVKFEKPELLNNLGSHQGLQSDELRPQLEKSGLGKFLQVLYIYIYYARRPADF